MIEQLSGFIAELRSAGIPISLTEHLDAARAITEIPMDRRAWFKAALSATLVKDGEHQGAFDAAFEVYFAAPNAGDDEADEAQGEDGKTASSDEANQSQIDAEGKGSGKGKGRGNGGGGGSTMSAEELAEMLYRAVAKDERDSDATIAREGVSRYAGMEPGRAVGGTYYLYRTLRNLDLEGVIARLREEHQVAQSPSPLAAKLFSDELAFRGERIRKAIEREIRERLVKDRGAEALAKSVRKPLPEDIDVMHAGREELATLQRALYPLSRKLAARLQRKRRRGHKGPLDLRRTVRSSLSSGGVPIDPVFKHPRPAKPEMIVIADISGSVASFARFTLLLVYALSSQFSKVRSFVFIDNVDEVTEMFERAGDPSEAIHRINTEADVVHLDGHSDYGRSLREFVAEWGDEITTRSTVLILGDARNNYHDTHLDSLAFIASKARKVFWLNPEPRQYWGSGDSVIKQYEPYCDAVVECRSIRQLEAFVGELA